MSPKRFLLLLVAGGVLTALLFALRGGSDAASASREVPREVADSKPVEPPRVDEASTLSRTAESGGDPVHPARVDGTLGRPQPATASDCVTHGVVVLVSGSAVADVRIRGSDAERAQCEATSDAHGQFTLLSSNPLKRIASIDPRYVTLVAARQSFGNRDQVNVVIAPAVVIRGVVSNEEKAGVGDASIEILLPESLNRWFESSVDVTDREASVLVQRSDGAGGFVFDRAPVDPDAVISVSALDYESTSMPGPQSATTLRIVLKRRTSAATVHGKVVDSEGSTVAGALVSLRGTTTTSDSSGMFALPIPDAKTLNGLAYEVAQSAGPNRAKGSKEDLEAFGRRLVAMKTGFLPGVYEAAPGTSEPVFPGFVVLQLGTAPLSIAGTVERADGAPLAGARVWIADPTFVAYDDRRESIVLENRLADFRGEAYRYVVTDSAGRFEIDGLSKRSYRVVAMDERTIATCEMDGVAAGTAGLVMRIATSSLHARVAGRVFARDGRGIENALIRASREPFAWCGRSWGATGTETRTDSDGRFELKDVPTDGVYLRVDGDGIEHLDFGVGAAHLSDVARDVTNIRIEVTREIKFSVELEAGTSARADAFSLVDAAGKRLTVYAVSTGRRQGFGQFELAGGRSGVLVVRETAATVVLWKDGKEIQRSPIETNVSGITTIKL